MGTGILIVLVVVVLFIAFRFFKASVGNSALKNDENAFLPDVTSDETGNDNDSADDAGDAGDSSDSGGNDGGSND